MAFTIEASPYEASRLHNNPCVVRVIKLELPGGHSSKPQQKVAPTEKYLIYPVDCGDQDQFAATAEALDALVGGTLSVYVRGGLCKKWLAKLTPDQVDQAMEIHGVDSVRKIIATTRRSLAPREKPPINCTIFPMDANNLAQFDSTEAALKVALGDKIDRDPWVGRRWVASLTKDEIELAKSIEGVSKVKQVHRGTLGAMSPVYHTAGPQQDKCRVHLLLSTPFPYGKDLDHYNMAGPAPKEVIKYEVKEPKKVNGREGKTPLELIVEQAMEPMGGESLAEASGSRDSSEPPRESPSEEHKYTILPLSTNNLKQVAETRAILKDMLGDKVEDVPGVLPTWAAYLTSEGAEQVGGIYGVRRVTRQKKSHRGSRGRVRRKWWLENRQGKGKEPSNGGGSNDGETSIETPAYPVIQGIVFYAEEEDDEENIPSSLAVEQANEIDSAQSTEQSPVVEQPQASKPQEKAAAAEFEYSIWPTTTEWKYMWATDLALGALFGKRVQFTNYLTGWDAWLTDEEVDQARRVEGVRSVDLR